MNTATKVTLLRVVLTPLIVACMLLSDHYVEYHYLSMLAAIFFIIGGITDFVDGYVARNFNQATAFGKVFDPIADKIIIQTVLVLLVYLHHDPVLLIGVLIVTFREVVVLGLREWMGQLQLSAVVQVTMLSKAKTSLQFIAITLLLASTHTPDSILFFAGYVLFIVSVVLTLASMVGYLRSVASIIKK